MSNRKNKLIRICLLAIIPISLYACSKKNNEAPDDTLKGSGMSMNINGKAWKSTMTTLFTEEQETAETGKYYYVSILGMRIISDKEDDVESQGFYITIPAGKFRNPKGRYPVIPVEVQPNHAWAVFSKASGSNYISGNPANPTASVGTIEITDFEVGQQTIMGHPSGKEGYIKLSGNFLFKLQSNNGNEMINVTDGKFNLKGALEI